MADKGLMQASASLAASQMPADIYGEFMKTFGAATAKFEKERQAVQQTVADYMGNLKSDIDFTMLAPSMESEVRSYLTTSKNEYAELANKVARIKDASSKEYQDSVSRMNEIQREFQILSGELKAYNQEKVNTAAGFSNNEYSNGNSASDLALHRDIYGLGENGPAQVRISNGRLNFNVGGQQVKYANVKSLMKPTDAPVKILSKASKYSHSKIPMTDEDVLAERGFLDEALKNQNNFASLVFDSPEELNLFEIKEDYIKAQEAGNLQEVMPSLIERTKDIIVNGYKDAARYSAAKYQSALNNKDGNGEQSTRYKMPETVQEMIKVQEDARAEGPKIGAMEPANTDSKEAKIFSLGPSDNPEQIRVKMDPSTKKWIYYNAKLGLKTEYDNLFELMNSHPKVFYNS